MVSRVVVAAATESIVMSSIRKKLALATCSLIAQGAAAAQSDWVIDTSYLSYVEANDRVAVKKTLVDLTRELDDGSLSVSLVHDTMSGASPTGAIRSQNSAVTFTGASGGSGFAAQGEGDYSLSQFDDTRIQAGVGREQQLSRKISFSYGGVVSKEADYDSIGSTLGIKRESTNKLSSINAGVAFTTDSIYRSDQANTPVPLSNTALNRNVGKGQRNTFDALLGFTRVLNRQTIAQVNVTAGLSEGYHSDPYKIISAADSEDRIMANFHDSRPGSRQRTTLFGKVVHQLQGTEHSIHLSYRLYRDDWGILSNTADFRYHHKLTQRQYLEPHVRFYHQTAADFYHRKLEVSEKLDPVLPEAGFASADYRLDQMISYTLGIKYGIALGSKVDFRVRTEYIGKSFAESDYSTNNAVVVQTSLKYKF